MKRALILTTTISLALGATQATAAGDPEAGKTKAEACASCHGPDGNSPTPQFPTIAGQYYTYIIKALEDYQSGARDNAIMKGFAAGLTDQDRKDLAAYYSRQKGLYVTTRD